MTTCQQDPPLFDHNSNDTALLFAQLEAFKMSYSTVHRYLCVVICICGVSVNLMHVLVLTRAHMRIYSVNSILSMMAVCDIITMCSYLIYLIRFNFVDNDANTVGYAYFWLVFLLAHVVISIALHTVSLYLSVVMAYIRWVALNRLDSKWIKTRSIGLFRIFSIVFTITMTLSVPTLLVHRIIPVDLSDHTVLFASDTANVTKKQPLGLYTVDLAPSVTENSCRLFKWNLWLTGVIFKAIPCMLMLWFTIALMQKLYETSIKRKRLLGIDKNPAKTPLCGNKKFGIDKTTRLLILMLAIFVCTELPQGALAILNAIYTNDVHSFLYVNLGEVLDLLSLINCNVGFVLYCCMSSRYRAAFRHLVVAGLTRQCSAIAIQLGRGRLKNENHSIP